MWIQHVVFVMIYHDLSWFMWIHDFTNFTRLGCWEGRRVSPLREQPMFAGGHSESWHTQIAILEWTRGNLSNIIYWFVSTRKQVITNRWLTCLTNIQSNSQETKCMEKDDSNALPPGPGHPKKPTSSRTIQKTIKKLGFLDFLRPNQKFIEKTYCQKTHGDNARW